MIYFYCCITFFFFITKFARSHVFFFFTESIGSGLDSDGEGNDSDAAVGVDCLMPKEYDPSIDDRLPDTVTLLTTPDGGKLYLIGTAHYSMESQDDVSNVNIHEKNVFCIFNGLK